jgi:PAS domain S-box-containing protein
MKNTESSHVHPLPPPASVAHEELAHYKSLYDHAPVGYCVISEMGVILQANFKAAAMLGMERDALIHQRLSRFILHEGQEEFYRLKKRLEEGSRLEAVELWMVKGDSTPFWAHLESTFFQSGEEGGAFAKIHLVLSDATERMRAGAKLRESEERFKYALEATRDGLWDFNLITKQVYFSPQWLKLLGYQDETPTDQVEFFFDLIHPDDIAEVQSSMADHLAGLTPVKQVEVRLRVKSGEYRWFFDRGEVVSWDDEGRPERMVGTITDITERKRAEAALQESEYRWKFAIEGSGDGLWDWDIVGGSVYFSKRWKEMLGYAEDEIGDELANWEERIHPEDKVDVMARTQAHLSGETTLYRNEQRALCKDGTWKWILARGMVVSRDASGRPLRMIGTHTDISARKQAVDALRASEERYRKLFEQNPQPMWVYDIHSLRFLAVNEMAIDCYGYSLEEFLAMTIVDIIPPEDLITSEECAADANIGHRQVGVWRHVLKDGQIIHVDVSSHSLESASRQARMVLAQNITERLLAEKRIRQQATLLDKAQDAILVHDLDHKILYWNQSAERLYRWTAAEALDQSVEKLLYRDSPDFSAVMKATLAKGEWVGEIRQITKDGTSLTVEGRWTLLHDERGIPNSILAIYTDITERKRLEQQFLRAQRMESIGTLAGGIAHDLNNVLAPIMMSIDLLKNYMVNPRGLEILEMIGVSTRRGADMVGHVLSFARGLEGKRIPLQIKHQLQELVSISEETFPKNIQIETQLDNDLWIVEADPTQLHQVLLNLCVNARDAMPDGGRITIRASNAVIDSHYSAMNLEQNLGKYLLLEVEDTGTGMTQEIMEEIFDPFFTTKEVGKGTGLGLSTAMAIVKGHGGDMRVYSELGLGSRFMVYIPAVDELSIPQAPSSASTLARGNGEVLLVVDDEESIREVALRTLEAYGYRVLLASNGFEALTIFQESPESIQVVLTDMMMPIMDGPTLIKSLKRLEPQVKIIGASGMADHELVTQAMEAGIADFLDKPYSLDTLLAALSRVITDSPRDFKVS